MIDYIVNLVLKQISQKGISTKGIIVPASGLTFSDYDMTMQNIREWLDELDQRVSILERKIK